MYIKITLSGRDTFLSAVSQRINAYAAKVGNAVQGAGIDMEAGAKQRAPVDTGRLRSSIAYTKITPFSCRIGTIVFYAIFVEWGHIARNGRHVPAQPFFFVSYLEVKQSFMKELTSIKM